MGAREEINKLVKKAQSARNEASWLNYVNNSSINGVPYSASSGNGAALPSYAPYSGGGARPNIPYSWKDWTKNSARSTIGAGKMFGAAAGGAISSIPNSAKEVVPTLADLVSAGKWGDSVRDTQENLGINKILGYPGELTDMYIDYMSRNGAPRNLLENSKVIGDWVGSIYGLGLANKGVLAANKALSASRMAKRAPKIMNAVTKSIPWGYTASIFGPDIYDAGKKFYGLYSVGKSANEENGYSLDKLQQDLPWMSAEDARSASDRLSRHGRQVEYKVDPELNRYLDIIEKKLPNLSPSDAEEAKRILAEYGRSY